MNRIQSILLILFTFSCSSIKKELPQDFLDKNYLEGVEISAQSYPQTLPLLFIYFDYIKNNRCVPREDLFNIFFKNIISDHSKVIPTLQSICKKTTKVKACNFIDQFKFKKSDSKKWFYKKVLLSNLILKEFTDDFLTINAIQTKNLKFISPHDYHNYWFEFYHQVDSNKPVSSFLQTLRKDQRLCLHMFDRHSIFKLVDMFNNRFMTVLSNILKTKKALAHNKNNFSKKVHLSLLKRRYWIKLSQSTYKGYGRESMFNFHWSETSQFCRLSQSSICEKTNSLSCFFLKNKSLNQCNDVL